MSILLKNANVYTDGFFKKTNISISGGVVCDISGTVSASDFVVDLNGCHIFPGFCDVHVHFREPGFLYKETIASGSEAAARSGYTTVCTMPNLVPAPDCAENLAIQLDAIKRDAKIRVLPFGTITRARGGEELSDMAAIAGDVAGFSDDGSGVENGEVMLRAMQTARSLGKIVSAHCETREGSNGCVNDCEFARANGIPTITCESEWKQIERDIELAAKTGCAYHVCHISTLDSVRLIREAKKSGIDVTCETAPHYLVMDDSMLRDDGRYKMNPPLRSKRDRDAMLEGFCDGTVDMIATDHAPHSLEEKSRGLVGSAMGITGLECAFPILYTELVLGGIIPLERLVEAMSGIPARRFSLGSGRIAVGEAADLCVYDLGWSGNVSSESFASKGKITPFEGWKINGKCKMTIVGGNIVWSDGMTEK